MKLAQLLSCLGEVQAEDKENDEVTGVTCDSRQVKPGFIFVAICGTNSNGENYIEQALQSGAVLIVSQRDLKLPCHSICVANAYLALALLAEKFYGYPAKSIRLVGLTGTNGKSSTSFIIEHMLQAAGVSAGVLGTIHNRFANEVEDSVLTTPDAVTLQKLLQRMKESLVEIAVLEVSSHALEQYRCALSNFDVALFCNLTQDHLDYHGDMESYYQSKKKLFTEGLKNSGIAVINSDDTYGARLIDELDCKIISVGVNSQADISIVNINPSRSSTSFELAFGSESIALEVPLIGHFNIINSAMAVAAVLQCGVQKDVISAALKCFPGVPGRLELFESLSGKRIFVDYAHTPDALEKVLQSLRPLTSRLICLFGCGGDRDRSKRKLMARAVQANADIVYISDDNPRTEDPRQIVGDIIGGLSEGSFIVEHDRTLAIEKAVSVMGRDDILLIAGKGHENYQIYGTEKKDYCDRQTVKLILETENANS